MILKVEHSTLSALCSPNISPVYAPVMWRECSAWHYHNDPLMPGCYTRDHPHHTRGHADTWPRATSGPRAHLAPAAPRPRDGVITNDIIVPAHTLINPRHSPYSGGRSQVRLGAWYFRYLEHRPHKLGWPTCTTGVPNQNVLVKATNAAIKTIVFPI